MQKFSLLDLSPIPQGGGPKDAFSNSVNLAQAAEKAGYHRYWMAEHHNMKGIASAATSVVVGHVAGATKTIRVGAGGIMLPNHAPLMVAEHFGTLATLYPDRIDLGVGRAPGTDGATMRALRRVANERDNFPNDVQELIGYFQDASETTAVRAIPGAGLNVPVWMLGSSTYGAQLAAHLGLPYAFASHFAPALIDQAIDIYRTNFKPSANLAAPYVMIGAGVCAADTEEEAEFLRSSIILAFAGYVTGNSVPLPYPVKDVWSRLSAPIAAQVRQTQAISANGSPEMVRDQLAAIVERYQPDELMVTGMIHDHAARVRSFDIAAEALRDLVDTGTKKDAAAA